MPKVKQIKYGIEVTKPHSKEMYTHNDKIAADMKRNIVSEIHIAYSTAQGELAAAGGMAGGDEKLRKIVQCFTGYAYGDGYDLEEILNDGLNTIHNTENWSMHQEYGYLVSEGIVPKLPMKMLGFDKVGKDAWDAYWEFDCEDHPDGNGMQC